jgi:hypothetical protein
MKLGPRGGSGKTRLDNSGGWVTYPPPGTEPRYVPIREPAVTSATARRPATDEAARLRAKRVG